MTNFFFQLQLTIDLQTIISLVKHWNNSVKNKIKMNVRMEVRRKRRYTEECF